MSVNNMSERVHLFPTACCPQSHRDRCVHSTMKYNIYQDRLINTTCWHSTTKYNACNFVSLGIP